MKVAPDEIRGKRATLSNSSPPFGGRMKIALDGSPGEVDLAFSNRVPKVRPKE